MSEQLRLIIYSLAIIGIITVIAIFLSKGLIAHLINGVNKNYNILVSVFMFVVICWLLYKKCIKNIIDFAEVKFLAGTTLIMFLVQILISNYYPAVFGISGSDIGIAKNTWKFIMGLVPIVFSVVLCQHFWCKLQEQLDKGEFNNSIYPTLMVAQGTFYTFLGVSVILFTYNSSYSDVNSLLAGLKMAFLTSVIGLLFSIAAKLHINRSQKEWVKENPNLELNRPTVTEEDIYNLLLAQNYMTNKIQQYIEDIRFYSQNQQEVMDRFAKTIDRTIANHMENTYEFQKQCMEKNLREVSESMISNVNKVFFNMTTSVDAVKRTCVDINKNLLDFNSNIKSSFDTFAQKLQTTDAELDKINDSVRKLNSTCFTCSDDITRSIKQASSTIGNFITALKSDSYQLLTEQKESHRQLTASIKAVDDLFAQNNAVIAQRFIDLDNTVVNNLKINSDKLQGYILAFNDITSRYVHNIEDTAGAIRSYNEEAKACIAEYKDNTDKMLSSLNNACRNLAESTEQYSSAQATVAKDIQKIKELVAITQNYSQILPRTKLEIDEAKQEIINHYKVIDKFIQDRNAEFNTKMENAYLTHADNLNGLLNASLTIISDVLKAAQDNYMSNLAKMENEIEDLRKEIRIS